MALIVNLSSIFKLKAIIPDGIYPFVKLCNDYSQSRCLCSKTLFGMTNYLWVAKQFYANQKLINEYKLGKLSEDDFLTAVLNIFSFLKNNKKVEDPRKLLAAAWNQIISWDEEATAHLKQLLECTKKGETVYLISNTNSLNIEKIRSLFAQKCPEVNWNEGSLQAQTSSNWPLELAPGIYLCLSYQYGLFKEGTPGLLSSLARQLEGQKLTVISQFPKDLEVARNLSFATLAASDFYEPSKPSLNLQRCQV